MFRIGYTQGETGILVWHRLFTRRKIAATKFYIQRTGATDGVFARESNQNKQRIPFFFIFFCLAEYNSQKTMGRDLMWIYVALYSSMLDIALQLDSCETLNDIFLTMMIMICSCITCLSNFLYQINGVSHQCVLQFRKA